MDFFGGGGIVDGCHGGLLIRELDELTNLCENRSRLFSTGELRVLIVYAPAASLECNSEDDESDDDEQPQEGVEADRAEDALQESWFWLVVHRDY